MSYILWIFVFFLNAFSFEKVDSKMKEMNVDICTFDGEPKKERKASNDVEVFLKTLKIGENNRPSQGSK